MINRKDLLDIVCTEAKEGEPDIPVTQPADRVLSDTAGELERLIGCRLMWEDKEHPNVSYRCCKFVLCPRCETAQRAAAELRELNRVARLALSCMDHFLPAPDDPDPEHEGEHRTVSSVKQALRAAIGEPR